VKIGKLLKDKLKKYKNGIDKNLKIKFKPCSTNKQYFKSNPPKSKKISTKHYNKIKEFCIILIILIIKENYSIRFFDLKRNSI